MIRSRPLLIAALLAAALAGGCRPEPERRAEVLVFAAASLREALQELGASFHQETGVRVVFNFAGSNDLAHQIMATRGPDLFLSASQAWMDTVQRAGRVVEGTRRDLLSNTLVVVANARDTSTMDGPCALARLPFRNLAIGDPEAVPAGTYAREWLWSVACDEMPLWELVQARVAPAPDVRAALGLVLADPRVIGIVYKTDQRTFAGRTRVLHEVRRGPRIRFVVARLAEGRAPENAARFYDYLAGPRGAEVFRRHGFDPLSPAAP
ncbi:MAG: molybdate ABC transporter substrate-binding protein [Gemmatimonadetes bacterium]|nr:molybdate ABC transporter substrate-binding protein [Gemmatimonadota bacterium]